MDYLKIAGILFLIAAIWQFLKDYTRAKGDVGQRMRSAQDKQATDIGLVSAMYHTKKATANTEHNIALTRQVETTYDLDAAPDRKRRAEQSEVVLHNNFLIVADEATKQHLTPATSQTLKLQQGLSQIKLLEARGLKDIDWEFLEKETNLQLKSAMLLAIKEHYEIKGLIEMYELVVRNRYMIENGDDPPAVKQKLLELYNKNLKILDDAIDGKGRLLKEVDWKEPEGTQPDSASG